MSDITNYTNPLYLQSTPSDVVYVNNLATPILSRNQYTVTWTDSSVGANINYEVLWCSDKSTYDSITETSTIYIQNGSIQLPSTPVENHRYIIQSSDASISDTSNTYYDGEELVYNGSTYEKIVSLKELSDDKTTDLHNTPDGNYFMKVRSYLVANNTLYTSPYSNTIVFKVKQLSTPTLNVVDGTCKMYFTNIDPDATNIRIFVPFVGEQEGINATSVQTAVGWPILTSGHYDIYAWATSGDALIRKSERTNHFYYDVIRLSAPEISLDDESEHVAIKWDAVPNADKYQIYLEGNLVADTNNTSYTFLNLSSGSHFTYVVAVSEEADIYANPRRPSSEPSNGIRFGKLNTPVIEEYTDGVIRVQNYLDYTDDIRFEVYNNGELLTTLAQNVMEGSSITLASDVPAIYSIQFKAVSYAIDVEDSDISNTIVYQFTKLQTPSLSQIERLDNDTVILASTHIVGATGYQVLVNGIVALETNNPDNIQLDLAPGVSEVSIRAVSNLYNVISSDVSNSIYYTVDNDEQFFIEVDDEKYPISVPITFRGTLDESMDTLVLSTIPLKNDKPFEAFSDIKITGNRACTSTPDDNNVITLTYQPLSGFPKEMIIAKDKVDEIMVGEESRYIHHIECIERTKLLQNELLPDFAISQPKEYVEATNAYRLGDDFIFAETDNKSIFSNTRSFDKLDSQILIGWNHEWSGITMNHDATFTFMSGLNSNGIINRNNMPKVLQLGSPVALPYDPAISFNIGQVKTWWNEWMTVADAVLSKTVSVLFPGIIGNAAAIGVPALLNNYISSNADFIGTDILSTQSGVRDWIQNLVNNWTTTILPEYGIPSWYKYDSLKDFNIRLNKTYKIRTHSDSYGVDENHPERIIYTTTGGEMPIWTPGLSYTPGTKYDIIYEIELPSNALSIIQNFMTNPNADYHRELTDNINFMYSGNLTSYRNTVMLPLPVVGSYNDTLWTYNPRPHLTNVQLSNFFSNTQKYRVIWKNVEFSQNIQTGFSGVKAESKSVYFALQKALDVLKPL